MTVQKTSLRFRTSVKTASADALFMLIESLTEISSARKKGLVARSRAIVEGTVGLFSERSRCTSRILAFNASLSGIAHFNHNLLPDNDSVHARPRNKAGPMRRTMGYGKRFQSEIAS